MNFQIWTCKHTNPFSVQKRKLHPMQASIRKHTPLPDSLAILLATSSLILLLLCGIRSARDLAEWREGSSSERWMRRLNSGKSLPTAHSQHACHVSVVLPHPAGSSIRITFLSRSDFPVLNNSPSSTFFNGPSSGLLGGSGCGGTSVSGRSMYVSATACGQPRQGWSDSR